MKILMIGMGGIGQRHARNLRALLGEELRLLAYRVRRLPLTVTDRLQVDPGKDVEKTYGLEVFTDLDRALAERPDLAFVCNPSSAHIPVSLACVRAGCDLFVEKPLSHNLEGVDELLKTVERHERVAMVGYQLRFHPCLQRLRAVIEDGGIGRLLAVRAVVGEYLPGWHTYEDYRQMYAARADLGGGVVLSQIHELDYLYALFGLPRRLFALGGHWSNLEIHVEDTASILMECSTDGRTLPVHLQQDYLQRPPNRQCEVIGDQGKVLADFNALSVTTCREGQTIEARSFAPFERNQLFLDELRHLLDCVKARKKPLVGVQEGAQSLRMALAARQSMASGQIVDLSSHPLPAALTGEA